MKTGMVGEDDLHGGGEGKEGAEYLYYHWGVDQVDLDFKTGKSCTPLWLDVLADLS